jgi:lipoyl-dependent peroxiredoxin
MSKHYADASWQGNLIKGSGSYTLRTSGYNGKLSFSSRFEDNKENSSPEELIGAAHASCFSMALAHALDQQGFKVQKIETSAEVTLSKSDAGFSISEVLLKTSVNAEDIDHDKFHEIANEAKNTCPVSRALTGTSVKLEAELA